MVTTVRLARLCPGCLLESMGESHRGAVAEPVRATPQAPSWSARRTWTSSRRGWWARARRSASPAAPSTSALCPAARRPARASSSARGSSASPWVPTPPAQVRGQVSFAVGTNTAGSGVELRPIMASNDAGLVSFAVGLDIAGSGVVRQVFLAKTVSPRNTTIVQPDKCSQGVASLDLRPDCDATIEQTWLYRRFTKISIDLRDGACENTH